MEEPERGSDARRGGGSTPQGCLTPPAETSTASPQTDSDSEAWSPSLNSHVTEPQTASPDAKPRPKEPEHANGTSQVSQRAVPSTPVAATKHRNNP